MKKIISTVSILSFLFVFLAIPTSVNATTTTSNIQTLEKTEESTMQPRTLVSITVSRVIQIPLGQSIPSTIYVTESQGGITYSGRIPLIDTYQLGSKIMCTYQGPIYGSL